jgi:PAS domain S-box-containing protein
MTVFRLVHSVLGYREDQLLGESLLSFIHSEDAAKFEESFARLLEGREPSQVIECRVRDPEGLWAWFEMRLSDQLSDPNVQAIVMNGRKIVFGPMRRPEPARAEA